MNDQHHVYTAILHEPNGKNRLPLIARSPQRMLRVLREWYNVVGIRRHPNGFSNDLVMIVRIEGMHGILDIRVWRTPLL